MTQDDLGLHHPNDLGYLGSRRKITAEFSIHPTKEMDLPYGAGAVCSEAACGFYLFDLSPRR
jgi:hypothetical protein